MKFPHHLDNQLQEQFSDHNQLQSDDMFFGQQEQDCKQNQIYFGDQEEEEINQKYDSNGENILKVDFTTDLMNIFREKSKYMIGNNNQQITQKQGQNTNNIYSFSHSDLPYHRKPKKSHQSADPYDQLLDCQTFRQKLKLYFNYLVKKNQQVQCPSCNKIFNIMACLMKKMKLKAKRQIESQKYWAKKRQKMKSQKSNTNNKNQSTENAQKLEENWQKQSSIDESSLKLPKKRYTKEQQKSIRQGYLNDYKSKRVKIPNIDHIPKIHLLRQIQTNMKQVEQYFNIYYPWNEQYYRAVEKSQRDLHQNYLYLSDHKIDLQTYLPRKGSKGRFISQNPLHYPFNEKNIKKFPIFKCMIFAFAQNGYGVNWFKKSIIQGFRQSKLSSRIIEWDESQQFRKQNNREIYLQICHKKYEFLIQVSLRIMIRMMENLIQGLDSRGEGCKKWVSIVDRIVDVEGLDGGNMEGDCGQLEELDNDHILNQKIEPESQNITKQEYIPFTPMPHQLSSVKPSNSKHFPITPSPSYLPQIQKMRFINSRDIMYICAKNKFPQHFTLKYQLLVVSLLKIMFGLDCSLEEKEKLTRYNILELYLKIYQMINLYKDTMKTAVRVGCGGQLMRENGEVSYQPFAQNGGQSKLQQHMNMLFSNSNAPSQQIFLQPRFLISSKNDYNIWTEDFQLIIISLYTKFQRLSQIRQYLRQQTNNTQQIPNQFQLITFQKCFSKLMRKLYNYMRMQFKIFLQKLNVEKITYWQRKFLSMNTDEKLILTKKDGLDFQMFIMDYYVNTIPTREEIEVHKQGRKVYKRIDFQYRLEYIKKTIRAMAGALLRRKGQNLRNVLPQYQRNHRQLFDVWRVLRHLRINDFEQIKQILPQQLRRKNNGQLVIFGSQGYDKNWSEKKSKICRNRKNGQGDRIRPFVRQNDAIQEQDDD